MNVKVKVKVKAKLRAYNRVIKASIRKSTYRDKVYRKTCNQDRYLASCQDQS